VELLLIMYRVRIPCSYDMHLFSHLFIKYIHYQTKFLIYISKYTKDNALILKVLLLNFKYTIIIFYNFSICLPIIHIVSSIFLCVKLLEMRKKISKIYLMCGAARNEEKNQ